MWAVDLGGEGGGGTLLAACAMVLGGVSLGTASTPWLGLAALGCVSQGLAAVALGEGRADGGDLEETFSPEEPGKPLFEEAGPGLSALVNESECHRAELEGGVLEPLWATGESRLVNQLEVFDDPTIL